MTPRSTRVCVACGATGPRVELNHVAARANDRSIVLPFCKPCHDVFTDWQWRLGILRRETMEPRAAHSESERAWALAVGLALTGLMAGPQAQGPYWVGLARAAGNFEKIRGEQEGSHEPWGPKPARARAMPPLPLPRRGASDPRAVLLAVLQAGDQLMTDNPDWPEAKVQIGELALHVSELATVPSEWGPAVDLLVESLSNLSSASGPADVDSDRAQREATLVAIRNVFQSGRQKPTGE